MRRIAGLLLIAFVAGCGGPGPGATPEETFAAFQEALRDEDYGSLVDLAPPKRLADAEKEYEKLREAVDGPEGDAALKRAGLTREEFERLSDARDFIALMFEKMATRDPKDRENALKAEVLKSEIDGDRATLTVSGERQRKLRFVRIDGLWYMD